MTFDEFLSHFDAVRKVGRRWTARCPAHDDRSHNTLHIALGAEGRRLVICRASCRLPEVLSVVGLHMVDLFAETDTPRRPRATRRPADAEPTLGELLQEGLREHRRIHTPEARLANASTDLYRVAMAAATSLRRQATTLGDVDVAWVQLTKAADLERLAESLIA